jgi:hypothetical protein
VLNNADDPMPLDSTGGTAPGAIGAACSLALLGTVVAAFSVFAVLVLGDDVAVSVSRGR